MPRKHNCRTFRRTRFEHGSFVCVYAHHVPGRLRLRLALSRDDRAVLSAASRTLLTIPAVSSVCPHFLTGSVIIHYDSSLLPPMALCESILQLGFISAAATNYAVSAASLTERVADAAIGRLFERVVESLALAAIAAVI